MSECTMLKTKIEEHLYALARVYAVLLKLERVAGIEPAYSAWKAAALPLSYTRAELYSHGPA